MKSGASVFLASSVLMAFALGRPAWGWVHPMHYAVRMEAKVSAEPPRIELHWPEDIFAKDYRIYRKLPEESAWRLLGAYPGRTSSFVDTNVAAGTGYEYKAEKISTAGQQTWTLTGYGYIYAGAELPLVEDRGRVILLVESSVAEPLREELARWESDLIADGWTVAREEASRSDSVAAVKARIQAAYAADPERTRTLLLFGNIPVPYSGDIAPDEHPNHRGAWPADMYYADLDGEWTDTTVNNVQAERRANHNVPGDGKFDSSVPPSSLELEVGRVDLSNLTCFANKTPSRGETDLLRRYLEKNHAFRSGALAVERRAILANYHLGTDPEPYSAMSWRIVTPFVGSELDFPANTNYLATAGSRSYLWSTVVSWGGYTYCNVVSADALSSNQINAVFTTFIGSYFGDWNNESNFLRATLGAPGTILTTCYGGKPPWIFHHMALGETIGYSTRVTQRNGREGPYSPYVPSAAEVHTSLLGDPTLRAHPLKQVRNLTGRREGADRSVLVLAWENPGNFAHRGYHVYRARERRGPYRRITASLLTEPFFRIENAGSNEYLMVKAVSLTETPSGSYFNASQGTSILDPTVVFGNVPPAAQDSVLHIPEDQSSSFVLLGTDPDGDPLAFEVVEFPKHGRVIGTPPFLVFLPEQNFHGADSLRFVARDGKSESQPATVRFEVLPVNDPPAVGPIEDVNLRKNSTAEVTIEIADIDSGEIALAAVSSRQELLADSGLTLAGRTLRIAPAPGAIGTAMVTVAADDSEAVASVSFRVVVTNSPPVAANDVVFLNAGETSLRAETILRNDADLDGDRLQVSAAGPWSEHGAEVALTGQTIALGMQETDSFAYTVIDSSGATAGAVVQVRFLAPPQFEGIERTGEGGLVLRASGGPERLFRVEGSADLESWGFVSEGWSTGAGTVEIRIGAEAGKAGFYRLISP